LGAGVLQEGFVAWVGAERGEFLAFEEVDGEFGVVDEGVIQEGETGVEGAGGGVGLREGDGGGEAGFAEVWLEGESAEIGFNGVLGALGEAEGVTVVLPSFGGGMAVGDGAFEVGDIGGFGGEGADAAGAERGEAGERGEGDRENCGKACMSSHSSLVVL